MSSKTGEGVKNEVLRSISKYVPTPNMHPAYPAKNIKGEDVEINDWNPAEKPLPVLWVFKTHWG